jgi:hypothetical protein
VTVQRAGVFVACPACYEALPPLDGVEHTRATNNTTLPHHSDAISSHRQTPILRGLTQRTPPASSSNTAAGSCVSLSLCGRKRQWIIHTSVPVHSHTSSSRCLQHLARATLHRLANTADQSCRRNG